MTRHPRPLKERKKRRRKARKRANQSTRPRRRLKSKSQGPKSEGKQRLKELRGQKTERKRKRHWASEEIATRTGKRLTWRTHVNLSYIACRTNPVEETKEVTKDQDPHWGHRRTVERNRERPDTELETRKDLTKEVEKDRGRKERKTVGKRKRREDRSGEKKGDKKLERKDGAKEKAPGTEEGGPGKGSGDEEAGSGWAGSSHEEASGKSERRQCNSLEGRSGGALQRGAAVGADHGAEDSGHSWGLLCSRRGASRRDPEDRDGGWRTSRTAGTPWDPIRSHSEGTYTRPVRFSGPQVSDRLRAGGERRQLPPCQEGEIDPQARRRASLVQQSSRSCRREASRKGRLGSLETEAGSASRRRSRKGCRERRDGRERGYQREEEKEEEEKEERGGQGQREVGWLHALEGLSQGCHSNLWGNWHGSQGEGEEEGDQKSTAAHRQEGKEKGKQLLRLREREQGLNRVDGCFGRTLRRDQPSQVHQREVPGGVVRRGTSNYAGDTPPRDRGGNERRPDEADLPDVLSATPCKTSHRSCGPGVAQHQLGAGRSSPEQAKPLCGYLGATAQINRVNVVRQSLDSVATHGSTSGRRECHSAEARGGQGLQGEHAGAEDEETSSQPRAVEARGCKRMERTEGRQRRERKGRSRPKRQRPEGWQRREGHEQGRPEEMKAGVATPENHEGQIYEGNLNNHVHHDTISSVVTGGPPDNAGTMSELHSGAFERQPATLGDDRCRLPGHVESGRVEDFSKRDQGGSPRHSGEKVSELGLQLLQRILEVFPLCSKTMGGGDDKLLFPLPTSRDTLALLCPNVLGSELNWLLCVCVCLNSFWGGPLFNDRKSNAVQDKAIPLLWDDVKRFCELEFTVDDFDWDHFFSTRSIDYQGDEVRIAKKFKWQNVAAALPEEIGRVPLQDVCTLGAKHYVEHFSAYLKPRETWTHCKAPKVMVADEDWGEVCQGLVRTGVCVYLKRDEVFSTDQGLLLNGMFGVTKDEVKDGVEVYRLIMNLIPLNNITEPMAGDINTLPTWSLMNPFHIQPSEDLLVSSEDVRCFFYTMSVPCDWWPFLAFNKVVPDDALPHDLRGEEVFLASRVLPMGFLNSVSLAQHVHRNLALASTTPGGELANPPECELRKDRTLPEVPASWRIYLDNYDLLERVDKVTGHDLSGSVAAGVLALRQQYEVWDVPRNTKKSVTRAKRAEVQGALVDGELGVAFPKPDKLGKYLAATLKLLSQPRVSQRQMQVVCGGLVYVAMYRRPLLGCLNVVWRFVESFKQSRHKFQTLPAECRLELLRFLGLFPLAKLNFRLGMHEQVTCSDASTSGGGICCSTALTPRGLMVSEGELRGHRAERSDIQVLSIGLFDGIGALRVALDLLGLPCLAHISVEKESAASRVVEAAFPGTVIVTDVNLVDETMIREWSLTYSQASLIILGAGPPCQGVSGLNADRKGALRDERSSLFTHVARIRDLLKKGFPWAPVHSVMESVASMDAVDRDHMSSGFGTEPWICDAGTMTWCSRPRLYWLSWDLCPGEGVTLTPCDDGPSRVTLVSDQQVEEVTTEGWTKVDPTRPFPTFTTSRPRATPGRKPAGVQQCTDAEILRWQQDEHRFPPYQYAEHNCLVNRDQVFRMPSIEEKEFLMGFPVNYTASAAPKGKRGTKEYLDLRHTLIGNSWSVPVVTWLLGQLAGLLGLRDAPSPYDIIHSLRPAGQQLLQSRLFRPPLRPDRSRSTSGDSSLLAQKMANLVSIKGEDVLLNTPTSQMVKYHRYRASVPSRLWKWKIVTGWSWRGQPEHINCLEMRAILTSIKWRICHHHHLSTRFLHLTDSLVALHCLSRGRSSSRKLRRVVCRINALLLGGSAQALWGYVHTDQNPADKPSRWGRRVRTKFKKNA